MKRRLFIVTISLMFIGGNMNAQRVGVNTNTPTENLDVKGTARVRELPLDKAAKSIHTTGNDISAATKTQTFTATSVVLSDTNNVIGRQTKEKFRDEMNRIAIHKTQNGGEDISSKKPDELKDIYIVDSGIITLPRCSADYEGKVLQFYKWGGTAGTWGLTTGSEAGGVFNAKGTGGFRYPTGVDYNNNTMTFNNTNLPDVGFRMIRLICITGDNKWFPDFGFR